MVTYSKRSRGVAGCSPASTTVQSHTLILNDLEEAAAAEGLGVSLTLDLENVEGQKNNLSDTDQTELLLAKGLKSNNIGHAHLPAVACMIALPVPFPKALSNSEP